MADKKIRGYDISGAPNPGAAVEFAGSAVVAKITKNKDVIEVAKGAKYTPGLSYALGGLVGGGVIVSSGISYATTDVKPPCYGPFLDRVSGTGGRMFSAWCGRM